MSLAVLTELPAPADLAGRAREGERVVVAMGQGRAGDHAAHEVAEPGAQRHRKIRTPGVRIAAGSKRRLAASKAAQRGPSWWRQASGESGREPTA